MRPDGGVSGQRVRCWLVWLSPPEWRARARIQVTTGRGGASPPWKPAMREWRDMARAGRAGGEYRLLTCRARHACYTHAYMPQSTAGGDGERRRKKQEPGKVRGVRSFRCVLSAHRQTTCNLELNKPSCTRADRHRSNIEVSQNPAARDQRRAGVGCERVQSSHGSPAPFCAQVPGRSDADPSGAERGGYVSAAASGLPASPFLWCSGNRAGCDGAGRLGADGGERAARTCRPAWPYARAAVDFAQRASRARARAVASRQPFGAAAAENRTA